MTDPFSVGAGAAEVISLGLTVCNGLLEYCSRVKAHKSDLISLTRRAEGLRQTLTQLSSVLESIQRQLQSHETAEIDNLTQCLHDCEDGLKILSEELAKCQGNGKLYSKKMLYPFNQGTLHSLEKTVTGVQSNLDTALGILNYAALRRVENQNTLSLSLSQSMTVVAANHSTTLKSVERMMQQMQQDRQQMQQDQQQMYQDQQQICQAIMSFVQSSSTTTRATTPSQQLLPPATLQSFCDQQQTINLHVRKNQQALRVKSTYKASSCTCPQNKNRSWNVFQMLPSHRYDCPLYHQGEDFTLFQKQFIFCNRFLQCSIRVTLGASTAEGAFTMKPPFGVRRVVPNNAPAFKLIRNFIYKRNSGQTSDSVMKHLRNIFDEGKASPRDTLSDGRNLLHFTSKMIRDTNPNNIRAGLRILQELVDIYHVPVNEEWQCWGRNCTFLDTLIAPTGLELIEGVDWDWRGSGFIVDQMVPFILKNLAGGGEITNAILPDKKNPHNGFKILYSSTPRILPLIYNQLTNQDLSLSDLDHAILQRSEQELKRLVEFHTGKGIELRAEVLLSAIPWPHGLEIILNSSAISCHRFGAMLRNAVFDGQQESVQLLLTHGWPITMYTFHCATGKAYQPELFQIIVAELYQRRRHLLHLVKANLNPELLGELGINDDTKVLDCDNHILREHIGGHPEVILTEIFPVYQHVDNNIQAAEALYEAGFTTIETSDRSPLLSSPYSSKIPQYLEVCSWLQDKGGSIHRRSRGTDLLPVHIIAGALGKFLNDSQQSTDWKRIIARHAKFLRDVLTDTAHRDSCSCACSGDGCLPSDVLMRELIWHQEVDLKRGLVLPQAHHMAAEFIELLCSQDSNSAISVCESLAPAVFRSCLFNELGITHTCELHYYWARRNSEKRSRDISRIHSEECHLIDRLEKLVLEIEAKYKELGVPLPEFLAGYFDNRLKELRAEENVFDEEEAQRMRSVGVILKQPVQ